MFQSKDCLDKTDEYKDDSTFENTMSGNNRNISNAWLIATTNK